MAKKGNFKQIFSKKNLFFIAIILFFLLVFSMVHMVLIKDYNQPAEPVGIRTHVIVAEETGLPTRVEVAEEIISKEPGLSTEVEVI